MDIFGSTTPPRWLDPQEEQLKWRSEADQEQVHQTQAKVALGTLALDQQQMDLKRQQAGAQLVAQGIQNNEASMDLNQRMSGMDEWNNIFNEANGDPQKILSATPQNPVAQQRLDSYRTNYYKTQAGMTAQKTQADFYSRFAALNGTNWASVNDAMRQDGAFNPDGTPTVGLINKLGDAEQAQIQGLREFEMKKAAVAPTIRGQSLIQAWQERNNERSNEFTQRVQMATARNDERFNEALLHVRGQMATSLAGDDQKAFVGQADAILKDTTVPLADRQAKAEALMQQYSQKRDADTSMILNPSTSPVTGPTSGAPQPGTSQSQPSTVKVGDRVRGPDGKIYPVTGEGPLPQGFQLLK